MSALRAKQNKQKIIQNSDPGKILDLVMSLTDETCAELQVKLNAYYTDECQAELTFQIITHAERGEAYIETVGPIVLKRRERFKVSEALEGVLRNKCETVNYLCHIDMRIQNILRCFLPEENPKRRILLYPIKCEPFQMITCVVGAAVDDNNVTFLISECTVFIWPVFKKTLRLELEYKLKRQCQMMLRIVRKLFSKVTSLEKLVQVTVEQSVELMQAECCRLLLLDINNMELYDAYDKEEQLRFPLDMGIAGVVISTGRLINLNNAKDHPSFDERVDSVPGKLTNNILSFPIREQAGIIGVLQLINKRNDPYFDGLDEESALAFGVYSGICIIHSIIHQKLLEAHVRSALAIEQMLYHVQVTDNEVKRIIECPGFHGHPGLKSLTFNTRLLPLRELPCYVLKMFCDLGFHKRFNIKPAKFAAFILHVRNGYRDVAYHNWNHAFNSAQWAYAVLMNFRLIATGYFSDLHGLMFFISALVHDIDNRGIGTSYTLNGRTTLAALFTSNSSLMERHHLGQALCILNTEGCNILSGLSRSSYDRAIILLRDSILATDLSNFLRSKKDYRLKARDFQVGSRYHANVLCCILTVCAAVSDYLKDWENVKKTAAMVMSEYYQHTEEFTEIPDLRVNNERLWIPDLQKEFLDSICLPLFEIITLAIPLSIPFIKILYDHATHWENAKYVFVQVPPATELAVLLSPELEHLIEINIEEREEERLRLERLAAEEEEEDKK